MKTKTIAALLAAGIAFTPVYASAQVCGIGLIVAAMAVNAQQHRELTNKEAATCGLMIEQKPQHAKTKRHAHKHAKIHKVAKQKN